VLARLASVFVAPHHRCQEGSTVSTEHIRQSMDRLAQHFAAQPQDALSRDKPAVATLEAGLRCVALGPKGEQLITDMPQLIGGGNSAPTPGWYLRAALANCDATVIAMRAAQLGIVLTTLEVTVDSESDTRGLLDGLDGVPAGPSCMQVCVHIAADGVDPQVLHELVHWAEAHSPVGDALRRPVPLKVAVQIG
jgi:uncharacterized OsmC-like protein